VTSPIQDKEPDVSLALLRAASGGDLDAVKSLLAAGVDVDCTNESGQTALILAAVMGHRELVAHLISAGADPRLRDRLDLTALEWSTRRGFSDVSQFLTKVSPPPRKPRSEKTTDSKKTDSDTQSSASVTTGAEAANLDTPPAAETSTTSEKEVSPELQSLAPELQLETATPGEPNEPAALVMDSATSLPPVDHASPVMANEREAEPTSTELATDSATPLTSVDHAPAVVANEPEAAPVSADLATDAAMPPVSVEHAPAVLGSVPETQQAAAELTPASTGAPSSEGDDPVHIAASTPNLESFYPEPEAAAVSATEPLLVHEEDDTLPQRAAPASGFGFRSPDEPEPAAAAYTGEDHAQGIQIPTQKDRAPALAGSTLGLSNAKTDDKKADVPNFKRCPRCGAVYQNSPLSFCTRDNATLIPLNELHQLATPAQTSTTPIAVWLLIAFVLGASGFAAYRLTERFYRQPESAPAEVKPIEAPPVVKKPAFSVGGDLAGSELSIPEPEYPTELITAGITGPITVRVRVNRNGRVISATTSNGDSRLRAAAVKAARLATFAPDKLAEISPRGRAVAGSITYELAAAQTNPATSPSTTSATATTSPVAGAGPSSAASPNPDPNAPVVSNELLSAASNVPAADYPPRAKRAGIGGAITVTIRVNRAGRVISWRSSTGDSQLRAAAIRAARKATFSREKLPESGDVVGTITYNFTP